MKKGFTLIELLATIAVLGIIFTIVLPTTGRLFNKIKKDSLEVSAKSIVKALEDKKLELITEENNTDYVIQYANSVPIYNDISNAKDIIKDGTIVMKTNKEIGMAIHDGKYCLRKNFDSDLMLITEESKATCLISAYVIKPTAIINLNTEDAIDTKTILNITSSSVGYNGRTIVNTQWENRLTSYPKGKHIIRLRVQDSSLVWSDWTEKLIEVQFINKISYISTTSLGRHGFLKRDNGDAYMWGNNSMGSTLTREPLLDGIEKASIGGQHFIIKLTNGNVLVGGANTFGQLGLGHTNPVGNTITALSFTNVKDVATTVNSTAIVSDIGEVWVFGSGANYVFGNGTTTNSSIPVKVPGLSNIAKIYGMRNSYIALTTTGDIYGWGYSFTGELAFPPSPTSQFVTTPTLNTYISGVKDIFTSDSSGFILKDDGFYVYGSNANGHLGLSDNFFEKINSVPIPKKHPLSEKIVKVFLGRFHTIFQLKDGSVLSAGANSSNQGCHNNAMSTIFTPTVIPGLKNPLNIVTFQDTSIFIFEDNYTFACGSNSYGELANGTNVRAQYLTKIPIE